MALKSLQMQLVLPAILLAIHFLIDPVTCGSHGPGRNTSLNSHAISAFGKTPVPSRVSGQSKACQTVSGSCTNTFGCCETASYGLACASGTCQVCQANLAACTTNTLCCAGLQCDTGGLCYLPSCVPDGSPCYGTGVCCGSDLCIMDTTGTLGCADPSKFCGVAGGECKSNSNCCSGSRCNTNNSTCYSCQELNAACSADSDCCDGNKCSGGTCQNCVSQNATCSSGSTPCCNNLPCTSTESASFCASSCVDLKGNCTNPNGVDICCDNYKCGINTGNTQQICVAQGSEGSPCTTSSECSGFLIFCGVPIDGDATSSPACLALNLIQSDL